MSYISLKNFHVCICVHFMIYTYVKPSSVSIKHPLRPSISSVSITDSLTSTSTSIQYYRNRIACRLSPVRLRAVVARSSVAVARRKRVALLALSLVAPAPAPTPAPTPTRCSRRSTAACRRSRARRAASTRRSRSSSRRTRRTRAASSNSCCSARHYHSTL